MPTTVVRLRTRARFCNTRGVKRRIRESCRAA